MDEPKKNWFRRLKDRLVNGPAPLPPRPSLTVEADGFSYVLPSDKTTVRWADVKEIVAFKEDIFAYDLICLAFRVSDEGECFEIDEEMPGYKSVLMALPAAFEGIRTDWFQEVAVPAFERNPTTLWRSDAQDPHNWPAP